jgi:tRNA dimethylallyltransferase
MAPPPPVVLLMGPTASGKSAAAMMLAQRFDGEIVGVDSAQVYRGMDIGTAKPTLAVRARVPHHLIDIRDAAMSYSVGEFTQDALCAMQDIWSRGRQPLLVGGTMMYFHVLTAGIAPLPEADAAVRAAIDASAALRGWAAVHQELAEVDPQAAAHSKCTGSPARPSQNCNKGGCRCLPTSISRNLRLRPLNAASYTPRSNSDSRQCSTPVSLKKSGAYTKEAI